MAFSSLGGVVEYTTITGTGNYIGLKPIPGAERFEDRLTDGDVVSIIVTDGRLIERTQGTWTAATKTVSRDVVSSPLTGAISWGSGRKFVILMSGILSFSDILGTLAVNHGGTGQTSYTNGQLLIGNTTGNTLTKASLTQPGAGLTITGGSGSITFALANDLAGLEGLSSTGIAVRTGTDTWAQRTITGTSNRLSVSNGSGASGNPTLDIDSAYVGQSSITTVGTLTGGATGSGFTIALGSSTITGTLLGAAGGTGVSNSGKTITLGGNLTTSGSFAITLTATGTSNATLPLGTHTLAAIDLVQTWTQDQLFTSGKGLGFLGASSAGGFAIYIGTVATTTPDPVFVLGRIINTSGNSHGLTDNSEFTGTGTNSSYNSYDGRAKIKQTGTSGSSHHAVFQARPDIDNTATVPQVILFSGAPQLLNTGGTDFLYNFLAQTPGIASSGIIGRWYGLKAEPVTTSQALLAWGVYVENQSYFGGNVGINIIQPTADLHIDGNQTDQSLIIDGTNRTLTTSKNVIDLTPDISFTGSSGSLQFLLNRPTITTTQNSSVAIYGLNTGITFGGANAFSLTGDLRPFYSRILWGASYTGTVSRAENIYIANMATPGGSVVRQSGIIIEDLSGGTNNSLLVLGATQSVVGDWSLYSASSKLSHFVGALETDSTFLATGNIQTNAFLGSGGSPTAQIDLQGSISSAAWTTSGIIFKSRGQSVTDTSSAAGTVAEIAMSRFGLVTLNSTNVVAYTVGATLLLGAPAATGNASITHAFAIHSTADIRIDGNILIGGHTGSFPMLKQVGTRLQHRLATDTAFAGVDASDIALQGATSGSVTLAVPATAGSNTLTFPAGTTDFSATGATGAFVKQASAGAAFTVSVPTIGEIAGLGTGVATALAVNTGSVGAVVLFNGALGTPSSGTLSNASGLPISSGVSGLGTGVATFLGTPSSVNLKSAVTDETGSGALVFADTPTLIAPLLGTPTSGNLSNCTAYPTSSLTGGIATANGLLKANGSGTISAATLEQDFDIPQAHVDLDFTKPLYWNAPNRPSSAFSVTRASVGYVDTVAGVWSQVASGALRRSNKGALIEEARTNSITNNSGTGAVAGTPGTRPTGWLAFSAAGTTSSIVGTGTENGVDYVDIRFNGTTNTTAIAIPTEGNTTIAAVLGQIWNHSAFLSLVAGSWTNCSAVSFDTNERNGAGTLLQNHITGIGLPGATQTRYNANTTLVQATVGFTAPRIVITVTNAAAVDFTLRIGWPQLELGTGATSPIRTTNSAATRAADVVNLFLPPTFGTSYSLAGSGSPSQATGYTSDQYLVSVSDGSSANRYGLLRLAAMGIPQWVINSTKSAIGAVAWAQATSGILAGANAVSSQAGSFNGAAVVTGSSATSPTGFTTVQIGGDGTGTNQFNGYVTRISAWAQTRLGNQIVVGLAGALLTGIGSEISLPSYSQSTPAAPTGTTNTTGLMMGLAAAITPNKSGDLLIVISGTIFNATAIADGGKVQIRYGTGTAPVNAAALTGTAVGGQPQFIASTTAEKSIFSVNAIVTGLTTGVAYWVDLALAAITGGTANLSDISISIVEL
jgi:hypothetical protein